MNSFIKNIVFQIDRRYADHVKEGSSFNPLLQPSLIGYYFLIIIGKLFGFSNSLDSANLSWKSSLMCFLGHSFFPNKYSVLKVSDEEIFKEEYGFSGKLNPKVTILILCGNSLSNLITLLDALESISLKIDVELILLIEQDNIAIDSFIKKNIQGVTVYHVLQSSKLLSTVNKAIVNSRGEFFSILRASVLLQANWLNGLLTGISNDQSVGIVTGKIISSDGLLDQAGTFIGADSHLHKYGKADFPAHPKYNFIREIACTNGGNSLVCKTDFIRVGGFVESSSSLPMAFCMLSMTFRQRLGKRILFTPQTEAIRLEYEHDENLDLSGYLCSTGKGFEAVSLEENIHTHPLITPKAILFVDIGLPEPDKDSGSLRAYHLIKIMKELGYHVIVVPRKGQVSSPYFEDLIKLGVQVLYAFPDLKGMIKELVVLLPSISISWICRPQLNKEFEWIFNFNPKIKWVFDTVDLHYVRLAREAAIVKSRKLMKKSDRFKKLELSIAHKADVTLTVTEDEKKLLTEQGVKNVSVVPNIHEIHLLKNNTGFSERKGLLFIGSYNHPPNVDAVRWLIQEIMPIVWETHSISVTLLGNAPSKEVIALESGLVKVTGYVKNVEPYFTSHRVFVAPLRYGAGMKGKIGQSLAYKLPVVTTKIGAEGVGLTDKVDVLLAEDKICFAEQIITVYQNEQLWNKLSDNSEKVLKSYSPHQIKHDLGLLLQGL